ncbi:ABC transporter ATP-binding protein [Mucilaginibacter psychrotolerans]|uniref:ATP-binding cassette domain-containing protein n=1 Tax=Mucilaginibacter psychrotolerans TaxID=1524096 RepID=A0A4Y8SHQ7_9SPHI|nr:ATP-binding cassette domain-containing protein [Mucilaginibacter psychrotolerans]TFF38478.1 ATP-binding cassette domain-containing protein [Mucilaginibacter psychrotolerans]
MIKVDGLVKTFGTTKAVDGISFEVANGETLALLGTSGCGKTTTLKMLNRLIEPDSGSIYINDKNILEENPEALRRGIGYVLQNNGLFPHYTVAENIAIVPQLLKWDKAKTDRRINELLGKLHLDKGHLTAYPSELSGGQQQRIGLARALVADPPVLLMDEPFGALDNVTRAKIHGEFKALDELKRKTIILVTHDVQEAFELADRIALMDKGKIVQIGTPAELLFAPKNNFVRDFLQEQRLQLEFRAIKISDLWEHLPTGGDKVKSPALSTELDLWSALEQFKFSKAETIQVKNSEDVIKAISFEQLMAAYAQYKTLQPHE